MLKIFKIIYYFIIYYIHKYNIFNYSVMQWKQYNTRHPKRNGIIDKNIFDINLNEYFHINIQERHFEEVIKLWRI